MKNINENEFAQELDKIKQSEIELKPIKTNKGEKNMKNIKRINWKKIIETIKTIIIYTAIITGIAFYAGMKFGENNAKAQSEKIVETVRNLSQSK